MIDPRDFYWRADDGRIFASGRQAVVAANDATFMAWQEDRMALQWPRDGSGAQTDAALQAVFDGAGLPIYVSLADRQDALCADIDVQAEAQRAKYITSGSGQAMIYLQKQTQAAQAQAGLAATPPMTADQGRTQFVLLAAEIGITLDPQTGAPATDVFGVARAVAVTVQAWLPLGAAIEKARLQAKAAIAAATTPAAAQAAHDAVTWPAAA